MSYPLVDVLQTDVYQVHQFAIVHYFEQGKMDLVKDLLLTLILLILLLQIFVVYFHKAFQLSLRFSISLGLLLFPLKLLLLLACFFLSVTPVFVQIWLQLVVHELIFSCIILMFTINFMLLMLNPSIKYFDIYMVSPGNQSENL